MNMTLENALSILVQAVQQGKFTFQEVDLIKQSIDLLDKYIKSQDNQNKSD